MYRIDLHGRVVGGLLEACGATNPLFRNQRPEVKFADSGNVGSGSSTATKLISGNGVGLVGLGQVPSIAGEDDAPTGRKKKGRGGKAVSSGTPAQTPTASSSVTGGGGGSKSGNLISHTSSSSAIAPPAIEGITQEAPRSNKKSKQVTELYCVCKTPWDEQRFMIGCDGPCGDWFHPECLGYMTTGKKDIYLQDADGVKYDTESSFFCPWCELAAGATGAADANEKKMATLSTRISKWCDVADMGDEHLPMEDSDSHAPFMTRWRILLQARNSVQEIAACQNQNCKKPHHPLLTCPIPSSSLSITSHRRGTSPRMGESNCSEDSNSLLPVKLVPANGDLFALVVGGKYQSLTGKVMGTSKKWSQIVLDADGTSIVTVPNFYLLFSREKSFDMRPTETDGTSASVGSGIFSEDFNGVVPAATGGGYIAYYDLDESSRIYLGRYSSRFRAARAYDLAAKLQCGDTEQGESAGISLSQLNFPDWTKLVVASSAKSSGSASPSLYDRAMTLAHNIAVGPYPRLSTAGPATNNDALHVLSWCENMLQELEDLPPYFPDCKRVCESLIESVAASAGLMAERVKGLLTESVPLPAAPISGADQTGSSTEVEQQPADEDELDIVIKKFIRTRSAKPKRGVPA